MSARRIVLGMALALCAAGGGLLSVAQLAGAAYLPDGRVYEMVTPPGNEDADVYTQDGVPGGEALFTGIGTYKAAADGDAVAYVASPTAEGNGSAGGGGGNQYLASRLPGGGWTQATLTPSHTDHDEYEAFSPDLTVGFIDGDHYESATLSPEVSLSPSGRGYNMLYERTFADGVYHPFYTENPTGRQTWEYGTFGFESSATGQSLAYAGSSENMGHLLFEANAALSVNPLGGVSPIDGGEEENNLYDSVNGQLQLVNVLPDGSTEPNATFGAPVSELYSSYNNEEPDFSHVISADGSRIFWSTVESPSRNHFAPKALYVRENDTQPQSPVEGGKCTVPADACTVQVSAGAGRFWTASTDGRYAFYTEDENLYRFDVETGERTDLTTEAAGTGDLSAATGEGNTEKGSNLITGVVTSTGAFAVGQQIKVGTFDVEPGTTITAVGPGTLELSEAPVVTASGTPLEAGSTEVTSVHAAAGSFLAGDAISGAGIPAGTRITAVTANGLTLSKPVEAPGTGVALRSSPEAQGVPGTSEDGEYLYFVADGILASGAVGGQPNLYLSHGGVTTFIATLSPEADHSEPSDNGEVGDWRPGLGRRTADVTPDGHSIVFVSNNSLTGYPNERMWEVYVYDAESGKLSCVSCDPNGEPPPIRTEEAAGYLPFSENLTYQPRVISEDGSRVFFDSPEPLVAHDTNGLADVYEWERQGSNGCEQSGGCVYLLSGGTSTDNSFLLDASANGSDVFMITRAQLVASDLDENYKLYDARVDGLRALTPPACSGTGCQGVPGAQPIFATPASVTYEGVGNFAAPGSEATVKPKPKPKPRRRARKRRRARSGRGARKAGRSAGVSKSDERGGR
jgi:hypothetical protein